jgi:tetratricopeptide (TPR) repeat protein
VALDDSLPEPHLMMGKIHMVGFDFAAAEQQLARAIALDPAAAEPHEVLVSLYLWLRRPTEALTHAARAVALDSLSPGAHAEFARALLGLDRCDEALAVLEKLSGLQPPLLRVADIAAQCYARQGRWPAAIAALGPQAQRGMPTALAQTAYMLARSGRRKEALRIHAALLDQWRRGDGGAFQIGLVHAGLLNLDQAVEWFGRALADRSLHGSPGSPAHLMLVLPGPLSDDLRSHAGFKRLSERLSSRQR